MAARVCVDLSPGMAELVSGDPLFECGHAYVCEGAMLTLTTLFRHPGDGGWSLTLGIRGQGSDSRVVMFSRERAQVLYEQPGQLLEEADRGE